MEVFVLFVVFWSLIVLPASLHISAKSANRGVLPFHQLNNHAAAPSEHTLTLKIEIAQIALMTA